MLFNPCSKSIFVPLIVIDNSLNDKQIFQTSSTSTEDQTINKRNNHQNMLWKGSVINHNNELTKGSALNKENKQTINQPQIKQCTCSKTKCLKKYCECYSNGVFCNGCNCKDCFNTPTYQLKSQSDSLNQNMTCTCSKSNCNKKYCECYKTGNKCNDKCRCVNCLNKKSLSLLVMERTSVFIHNSQTIIVNETINLDKSLGNKRWRGEQKIDE